MGSSVYVSRTTDLLLGVGFPRQLWKRQVSCGLVESLLETTRLWMSFWIYDHINLSSGWPYRGYVFAFGMRYPSSTTVLPPSTVDALTESPTSTAPHQPLPSFSLRKPYTPRERLTERRRLLPAADNHTVFPVSNTTAVDGGVSPEEGSSLEDGTEKKIEERMLHKEIVHSFSRFQFHKTESGERTPMQFRYLANLKIARMQELLNQLSEQPMSSATLEHIVRALRHLTELCVRNRMVLWFSLRHIGFVQKISKVGLKVVEAFDGRQMAVMIWTIGKIGGRAFKSRSERNFSREIVTQFVRRLLKEKMCQQLSVHESMLLINGLANLDCTQLGPLLDASLPTFTSDLPSLSHEVFSLFLWSYGKLGYRSADPELTMRLMEECRKRFESLSVQQLSSVVWGLCRMDFPEARTFLIECLSIIYLHLSEFVPLGIARLIDACYLMNHHPGEAITKLLSNRFSHFRGYATPALCFQALPAFAYFDGFSEVLYGYSYQGMKQRYNSLVEAEQMVRILAAYSVGDTPSPSFLEQTVASLLEQDIYRDLPPAILRELWIGIATHRAHYGEIVNRAVPNSLLELAKEAWIREETDRKLHPLTEEILGLFKEINVTGNSHYCEPVIEIRSDFVCLWESRRIGVFIFDHRDTFANDSNRLNGHALWRERIFMKMDYGVGRISAIDWEKLTTPVSKRNYLLAMFKFHRRASHSRMSRSQMRRIQSVYLNTM